MGTRYVQLSMATTLGLMMTAPAHANTGSPNDDSDIILGFLVLGFICLAIYIIPTIVAFSRSHPNRWPILLLNLVLGSTVIGWLGALIWAMSAVHRSPTGNHGGESGLNIFVNDQPALAMPPPFQAAERLDVGAVTERLQKLNQLRANGAISDEEYQQLKAPLVAEYMRG